MVIDQKTGGIATLKLHRDACGRAPGCKDKYRHQIMLEELSMKGILKELKEKKRALKAMRDEMMKNDRSQMDYIMNKCVRELPEALQKKKNKK
jgi:hypothetical protein